MKLSDRQNLYQTRYSQSFSEFANRTKLLNSTAHSNTFRLPQLSRSFSSSSKNNLGKVTNLEDVAKLIGNSVRQLKLETRESKRYCMFLREDLIERRLAGSKNDLLQKLNVLDKLGKAIKNSNQQRTQTLKIDCKNLMNSTKAIKNFLADLNLRIDAVQNTMGIYNGKQKHKY